MRQVRAAVLLLYSSLLISWANAQVIRVFTQKQDANLKEWYTENHDKWSATSGVQIQIIESTTESSDEYMGLLKQFGENGDTKYDIYAFDLVNTGVLSAYLLELGKFDEKQQFTSVYPGVFDNIATQDPAILANDVLEGRLLGLPQYMNVGLMYYRKDLLAKYGYSTPPQTWDELEDMATTIITGEKNPSLTGYVAQFAQYEGLTCNGLEFIHSCGGGSIVDPVTHTITVNNPQAEAILARVRSWVTQKKITPVEGLAFREADTTAYFASGNAVFMRYWDAFADFNSNKWGPAGTIGVAPLPGCTAGQSAATLGGWHLAVNKYTQNPSAAVKAIAYMTSLAYQRERAMHGPFLPTHPSIYEDATFCTGNYTVWCNTLKSVQPVARPSTVAGSAYTQFSQMFYIKLSNILYGNIAPGAALQELFVDTSKTLGFELPAETIGFASVGGVAISIFTAVAIGACLLTAVLLAVYRDRQVVKSSSFVFLELILFGLALGYSTVFLYIDEKAERSCRMIPIWLALSFGIVIGGLLAKTWRIRTIFAARIRLGKISDLKTLRITAAVVIIEAILLAIWSALAPATPAILEVSQKSRYWECAMGGTPLQNALGGTVLVYNVLLLVATTALAYMIRHVASRYNESKLIGLAMYNIVVFVVIIPVISHSTGNPFVIPVGILLITTIVFAIVFFPKIYTLLTSLRGEKEDPRRTSQKGGMDSEIGSGGKPSTVGADSISKDETIKVVSGHADVRIARSKMLLGAARWIRRRVVIVPGQSVISEMPLEEASGYKGTSILVEDLKFHNITKSPEEGYSFIIQVNKNTFYEFQTSSAGSLDAWMEHLKAIVTSRSKIMGLDSLAPAIPAQLSPPVKRTSIMPGNGHS